MFEDSRDRCNLWAMKSHLLLRLLLICAALMLAADSAFACSCGATPPVLNSYESARAVVIARVISIEPFKNEDLDPALAKIRDVSDYGEATLVIEKVYKGNFRVNEQFSFGERPNAACIWSFRKESVGHRFLIYSSRINGYEGWFVSTCGRSRHIEWATEDLLYLDNMEKYRGKSRVSGKYSGSWNVPFPDVANRTIRFIGEKNTYETRTNADGVYEIYDLPPGKYELEPEIPNGWELSGYLNDPTKSIPFTLEAKKHVTLDVKFAPSNVVEGRVVGPNGNPMKGVCVDLLKPGEVDGDRSDCTGENGEFRIESVPEGSYVVAINADGKLSPEEPFPTIFYPSVSHREKATLITISNGETVKGINFVVSQVAETIELSGVLLFSDGKPVVDEYVTFQPPREDESESVSTESEGRFTIRVIKGVKGEIYATIHASLGDYDKCPKIDALIKASGEERPGLKSSTLKVHAQHDVDTLVVQFPFPRCKRKE